MSTEITMPKLSDTMTEGRLVSWKKSVGEHVERGEIIAEVETDKATMELEAFASGTLLEIRIKPGEMVPVGTVIGVIGGEGEKAAGKAAPPVEAAAPEEIELSTGGAPAEKNPAAALAAPPPDLPGKLQEAVPVEAGDVPERIMELPEGEDLPEPPQGASKASPLVRRLAREKGIDLGQVTGSGPEGRILQEDLEKAGTGEAQKPVAGAETVEAGGGAVQPLSRMRAAIARTVTEAWRTIPHFFVTVEVEMGEAERVRQELKGSGNPVSLNDFVVKAAAVAIGKFPRLNASFAPEGVRLRADVNIGIAVALEDGLLVPVVKGCQGLSLKAIAGASRDLISRAKTGKVGEADMADGTFSISNLGMYGVDEFAAVIHPSQGAILAVGAVADRPVIRGGHLVAGRVMRLTLSADHRLIDGAYAARFLRELKRILENPVSMLL